MTCEFLGEIFSLLLDRWFSFIIVSFIKAEIVISYNVTWTWYAMKWRFHFWFTMINNCENATKFEHFDD